MDTHQQVFPLKNLVQSASYPLRLTGESPGHYPRYPTLPPRQQCAILATMPLHNFAHVTKRRPVHNIATVIVASVAAVLAAPLLVSPTPAAAAPTANLPIDPVGYNIVKGEQDFKNPITNPDLMKDTGSTSTPPSLGTHSVLEESTTEETAMMPRQVIEGDSRKHITGTKELPFRWVGKINFVTAEDTKASCTGSLISPDTVITAGHCLARKGKKFTFTPGINGSEQPFRTASVTQVWYDKNFGQPGRDWGVMKLETPIGSDVGWFGMQSPDTKSLDGKFATIVGYPGDKEANTMWKDRNKVLKTNERQVYYTTDTFGGQSGAAILDDSATIYGIHTSGKTQQNWGTLLTGELFNAIVNISKLDVPAPAQ